MGTPRLHRSGYTNDVWRWLVPALTVVAAAGSCTLNRTGSFTGSHGDGGHAANGGEGGTGGVAGPCEGVSDGTPCGSAPAGPCDAQDVCEAGVCSPTFAASGTSCGDPTDDDCTDPDSCDGAGLCLDNHVAAGAACGDTSVDACTDADTCDGDGLCLVNHAAEGTACGDTTTSDCDAADACTSAGLCDPNDATDGQACGDCTAGFAQCGLCAAAACPDACQVADPTATTTFANDNGDDGSMFDVVALNDLTITGFDVNVAAGTWSFELYTLSGGHDGHETTAGDWTLVTTFNNITSAGDGAPTALPDIDVDVASAATQAFYITLVPSQTPSGQIGPFRYTDTSTFGAVYVDDGNLQILEGSGKSYPFAGTYRPRTWNGNVRYYTTTRLATAFTGATSIDGVMFDVQATAEVKVRKLDLHLPAGTHDVEVFLHLGSHAGVETTSSAWTQIASQTGVVSAGPGLATSLSLKNDFVIPAGATYALYIATDGTKLSTATGSGMGTTLASDSELTLTEGVGMSGLFGTTVANTAFDGGLRYSTCN